MNKKHIGINILLQGLLLLKVLPLPNSAFVGVVTIFYIISNFSNRYYPSHCVHGAAMSLMNMPVCKMKRHQTASDIIILGSNSIILVIVIVFIDTAYINFNFSSTNATSSPPPMYIFFK